VGILKYEFLLDRLMPRRKLEFRSGCYYHLYNRGHNRQKIFFDRRNYLFFLRQLRDYLAEQTVDIVAYCLMPNHYHLLVYLRSDNLSDRMQAFILSYTKAINQRYGRCGSLFQGRFQAIWVDTEEYLLHLSRYIHLNPVKAGLVERPEDWEFSSYRDYLELRQGQLLSISKFRKELGSGADYRLFVESEKWQPTHGLKRLLLDE
jgi:REP element-mobilizing transposase RayT